MKHLLLFCLIVATAPAWAQTQKPYKPETDGAYYSSKDRAAAAAHKPFGVPLDSTLTGIAALDARNGFRGYAFGTPVTNYPALRRWSKSVYIANKEPLSVGGTPITKPVFQVKDGVLTSVSFSTAGPDDVKHLLETLQAQYGQAQEVGVERMVWHGKVATMVFQTNATQFNAPIASIRHLKGTVTIYNNALAADAEAVKAAATKRATGDL